MDDIIVLDCDLINFVVVQDLIVADLPIIVYAVSEKYHDFQPVWECRSSCLYKMFLLFFLKRFFPHSVATFVAFQIMLISATQDFSDGTSFLQNVISGNFNDCKFVHIIPSHSPEDGFYTENLVKHAQPNQGHLSAGNFVLTFFKNMSYNRVGLEDVLRYNPINCALAVISISETTWSAEKSVSRWLFDTTTPPYAPLLRKDEDRFIFLCRQTFTCDQALLSAQYGNKIKYKISISSEGSGNKIQVKTVALFGQGRGNPILLPLDPDLDHLDVFRLFPDTTHNFRGKCFSVSNPRTKTYFDVDLHSDGSRTAKRGLYKLWLDEMMTKFNFSIRVFESSLSGGSGKQLPNGTWGGTVGDVMYGAADMGAFVGHTFNRHGTVGYSTTITYEWMFFITHKPYQFYTSTAIFKPLSFVLWIGFLISLVFLTGALKFILKDKWTLKSTIDYVVTTFLEQDSGSCIELDTVPIRILVTFWLLFALIFSTAYRGKLVSLIAFPMSSWVPWTYEDLAYSDFRVGLHVVGKGGAADSIFSSSSNPVFKILNSKMKFYSTPTDCMREALVSDIACVLWRCHFEYGLHDGFTDKFGRSPFHTSLQTTYFLHDGFIWESRAVFHEHIDRVGWSILEMGVSAYWLANDHNVVMKMRFDREKAAKANQTLGGSEESNNIIIDDGDEGPSKLKLVQFKGLFILFFCGVVLALARFAYEKWLEFVESKRKILLPSNIHHHWIHTDHNHNSNVLPTETKSEIKTSA